jgi:hypothetical protein
MAKVEPDLETGCWNWTARVSRTGCPLIWVHEKDNEVSAARVIYEHRVAPLFPGQRLTHTCGNRKCVNPAHMKPGSAFDAMMRSGRSPSAQNKDKTHCPKGHPYEGDNLRIDSKRNYRQCKECRRERSRIAMRRKYLERKAA